MEIQLQNLLIDWQWSMRKEGAWDLVSAIDKDEQNEMEQVMGF